MAEIAGAVPVADLIDKLEVLSGGRGAATAKAETAEEKAKLLACIKALYATVEQAKEETPVSAASGSASSFSASGSTSASARASQINGSLPEAVPPPLPASRAGSWAVHPLFWLEHWREEGWGDALSSLPESKVAKGEACCTWKKTTKWRLGAADLLEEGAAYRFRVRAVNRMGASKPGAPSPILHWPPQAKQLKEADDCEPEKNTAKGANSEKKKEPTEACANHEVSQADLFTSHDSTYTFQSKPPTERQLTGDKASVKLYELATQYALEGDYTKLGFIFTFSLLTGRFELVFDAEKGALDGNQHKDMEVKHDQEDRTHQHKDMEFKHDQKDRDRLPQQRWFNQPLTPDDEEPGTPNWFDGQGPLPCGTSWAARRESLTAARLLVQAGVLRWRGDGQEVPNTQPHLYALLSIVLAFLELEPGEMHAAMQKLCVKLPAFPIAHNRVAIASSNGVRPKRGQVWTFMKAAFAWAREAVEYLPGAAEEIKANEEAAAGMHTPMHILRTTYIRHHPTGTHAT